MKKILGFITFLLLFIVLVNTVYAQQGCCSWHGGIDYCDTSMGVYVCNDGTYSPTCGCYYEPPIDVPEVVPTYSDEFYDGFEEFVAARVTRTPTPTPSPFIETSSKISSEIISALPLLVMGTAALFLYWLSRKS